jgi:branched-chain amino acid transport system substrate-binding protein
MNKNKLIIGITILLIIGIIIFNTNMTITGNLFLKEENTIKIGALYALTGKAAQYGISDFRGAELAKEKINSDANIFKKIKIIYQDTKSNPKETINAYQNLNLKSNISVFIGGITSGSVLALSPIVNQDKKILISTMAGSKDIKYAGDYIFRTRADSKYYSYTMAKYAIKKYNTVGIIYTETSNAINYKDFFKEKFEELGGKINITKNVKEDSTDYKTELIKIKKANPDAIYICGYYTAQGQILKQAKELNINIPFISNVAIEDQGTIKIAQKAAEGVVYSASTFDVNSDDPKVKQFVEEYKQKYNEYPNNWAANTYDAVMLTYKCINKYGYSSDKIKECFYNIKDYKGVSGNITFDEYGEAIKLIRLKIIKNGEFMKFEEN